MKHILFSALLTLGMGVQAAKPQIDRIEPANWWANMKDTKLQLMVYGKGIAHSLVSTDYAGVRIDSVVSLDSPNYLFVYLDLQGARPGAVPLTFSQGKKRQEVSYPILQRDNDLGARQGFTNKDVMYMLMPDRFAQGKPERGIIKGMNPYEVNREAPSLRHGGDLEGIRKHLDYFTRLGVTALWFTPVLENNSPDRGEWSTYHGYATTDYYRVDPRFGSNEEYRQLVREAHGKGLKVVMDMIFNHCGLEHPWLRDLPAKDWLNLPECVAKDKEGNPKVNDKFKQTSYKLTPVLDPYASKIDLQETTEGWFVETMPDLNQHNPHVMQYLIQNSVWWIETTGIDGIRMDTYPYAFAEGMAQWMKRLSLEYPQFNVVGETWVTEAPYTAAWQKGSPNAKLDSQLPTVMDFAFYDRITQAREEETDAWWKGLNRVYNSLVYDYLYPNPSSVMAFVENHDTDRFLGNKGDVKMLKQALALLLTMNRIPQLYYGTEVLMGGTKEVTDGDVRKDFPGFSEQDPVNAFTGKGLTAAQQEMLQWMQRLLHWRKSNRVVTEGRQVQFIPWKGVYVIARQLDNHTVLTVMNGTTSEATWEVARYAEVIQDAPQGTDVLTGRKFALSQDIKLQPRETLVLEF